MLGKWLDSARYLREPARVGMFDDWNQAEYIARSLSFGRVTTNPTEKGLERDTFSKTPPNHSVVDRPVCADGVGS